MSRHAVLDAIRQTLRCEHCRAEVAMPKPPLPIDKFSGTLTDFGARHNSCAPIPRPAPCSVRTGPDGDAYRRDHEGLWWAWLPEGRDPLGRPRYQVQPLTPTEVRRGLEELAGRMSEQVAASGGRDWDAQTSLEQAQAALESEGWA